MKKFLQTNSFVFSIILAVSLAALFPVFGSSESILPIGWLKKIGIFLIFFNQGVLLPSEELKQGFLEARLHALIQASTYLFFPLVVFLGLWASSSFFIQPDLRAGFLYLAFLPTTISSAVALTSVAGGNVSGALFNCALSSVMGVFLTPLLCVFFLGQGGSESQMDVTSILFNVMVTLLVPLITGQLFRRSLKAVFGAHKNAIKRFNNGVILFIIWSAFCESFLRNVWDNISGRDLGLSFMGSFAVILVVSGWVWWMSGKLRLSFPSRVTALFCGSQKTIAMGLPLSAMIFASETSGKYELSLLIIPLMIYHPLQLIVAGWFIPRLQSHSSQP